MAGHSHWAGIKHKKGKADKQRSKIFSKLSKEITVAAKLGDKDPAMNPRLRSAIQAARSANMPKDNIERAIDKSSAATGVNFENLRYEGFGPDKIAVIVETLTDNKNRTASNIRTILFFFVKFLTFTKKSLLGKLFLYMFYFSTFAMQISLYAGAVAPMQCVIYAKP